MSFIGGFLRVFGTSETVTSSLDSVPMPPTVVEVRYAGTRRKDRSSPEQALSEIARRWDAGLISAPTLSRGPHWPLLPTCVQTYVENAVLGLDKAAYLRLTSVSEIGNEKRRREAAGELIAELMTKPVQGDLLKKPAVKIAALSRYSRELADMDGHANEWLD